MAVAAMFAMSVSYLDRQMFAVLSPTITRELGLSDTQYGWLNSAFALAYLVGALLAGRFIDRVGSRRGLVAAVGVWTLVAALHMLSAGFASLLLLRIALGLAESPSFLGAAHAVRSGVADVRRPTAIGLLYSGSSIGAALAPLVGLRLAAALGWRAAFIVSALLGLLWIPFWLVTTAKVPALMQHVRLESTQPHRPQLAPVVRAGLLMLGVAPLVAFFLSWAPKFLVATYGSSGQEMATLLWIPPLCFDSGSLLFGACASWSLRKRKAQRDPYRALAIPALLLALCVAITPRAASSWLAMLWSGLTLIGAGGLYAILTADLLARVPAASTGMATGFMAAAQSIAQVLAHTSIGALVQATGGYTWACALLALWLVPLTAAWWLWQPTPPNPTPA